MANNNQEPSPEPDRTIFTNKVSPVVFSRHNSDSDSVSRSLLPGTKHLSPNTIIIGTCDGLICLSGVEPAAADAYVLNPATGKSETLDKFTPRRAGENSYSFFGFGYDSVRKEHKVVKITQSHQIKTVIEIRKLLMNVTKSKVLQLLADAVPFQLTYAAPVTVNGCSHWIAVNLQNKSLEIVRFDMEKDSFVELPFSDDMPNVQYDATVKGVGVEPVAGQKRRAELKINSKRFRLGVFQGRVCLIATDPSKVEIWSMQYCKTTIGVRWIKEVEIEKSARIQAVLGFTANDEMVICNSQDGCFAYDIWKRRSIFSMGQYSCSKCDFDNQVVTYKETNLLPLRPQIAATL